MCLYNVDLRTVFFKTKNSYNIMKIVLGNIFYQNCAYIKDFNLHRRKAS